MLVTQTGCGLVSGSRSRCPAASRVHPSELVSGRVCMPASPGSGGGGTSFLPPRVAETVNNLSLQKACSRGTLPGSSSVMCGCWKEPCLQPSHLQSTQLPVPDPKPAAQPRYAQAGPSDPACLLHPPPHTHTHNLLTGIRALSERRLPDTEHSTLGVERRGPGRGPGADCHS